MRTEEGVGGSIVVGFVIDLFRYYWPGPDVCGWLD